MRKLLVQGVAWWGAVLLLGAVSGTAASVRPAQLRCEHLEDPVGSDVVEPRLSWWLEPTEAGARGLRQTGWQVQVASTRERLAQGQADRWDSGQVESDQSVLVRYAGTPLRSRQECFWRVRVWDEQGRVSAWSPVASWTMGLLAPDDWRGAWIGKDEWGASGAISGTSWIWHPEGDPALAAPPEERYFRRRFEIAAKTEVLSARLLVAADNEFMAYVNGRLAGRGAGYAVVTELDVAALLAPGENVLAVAVRNVGAAPNPAGLLARLEVVASTGERAELVTDESWKTSRSPSTGWQRLDYNHGGWQTARVLGPAGMPPWGAISGPEDRRLPARYLRKEFRVSQSVRRATLYASGLGWSEFHLNGRRVGDHVLSPGLADYAKRVFYVAHDVTSAVRRGPNCLGAVLGNGRFFAPRLAVPTETRTFGYPKLLLQLEIEYADGSTAEVVSDATWKLTTQGPITANNEYDGEDYDARRELGAWAEPGFDDRGWETPETVVSPGGRLAAPMTPPIRVVETRKPLSQREAAPGLWVFDFGQNLVGWCRLTVRGKAGTVVTLRHAETLHPDGTPSFASLRGARATDTYTLKGQGVETFEPRFTCHGFRYVAMRGYPGVPGPEALEARVISDDLVEAGQWSSSNPLLDRIYQNLRWGVRGNYRSLPTDCPQRDERQGWLGDRAEAARGEAFLFHNATLYRKWVQDMADAQRDSGSVPDVCPPYWPVYTDNATWPASFVLIPGHLLTQFGDLEAIRIHYPAMQRWVEHLTGWLREDLLPRDTYGDWGVPPEDPRLAQALDPARPTHPTLLGTATFIHCLRRLAAYADLLDRPEDARRYRELAARLQRAFNARFFIVERGCYDNGSPTSSLLPLAFELVPEGQGSRVLEHLVRTLVRDGQPRMGTGVVGGQWLLRTLTALGRADLAYQLAANRTYPSWGYMVERGATTLWELWNGDTAEAAPSSGNHVMLAGDLGLWLYEDLAGLRADPARPGFKHILMKPHPVGDLTQVAATHRSPYGVISSAWRVERASVAPSSSAGTDRGGSPRRDSPRFTWEVRIPPNTSARLSVPAAAEETVLEGGKPALQASGLRFLGREGDRAVFEAVSGEYRLEVR